MIATATATLTLIGACWGCLIVIAALVGLGFLIGCEEVGKVPSSSSSSSSSLAARLAGKAGN